MTDEDTEKGMLVVLDDIETEIKIDEESVHDVSAADLDLQTSSVDDLKFANFSSFSLISFKFVFTT